MAQEPNIKILLHAQTNIGMVRHGNEDNFLVVDLSTAETWTAENAETPPRNLTDFKQGHYGTVIAVSDGMGGALAGEVASQMAASAVRDRMLQFQASPSFAHYPFHERLRLCIEQANLLINVESQNNVEYTGMGATFTAAGLDGDIAYLAQVGDSRCYMIRQGKIAQVTKDQSLVSQLVEAGHITEEEAESHTYKNVILQALGAQPRVNVIVDRVRLRKNDMFLLCSDGLSGKMKGPEMLKIVMENPDIPAATNALIKLANERGGEDNITVVIARFDGDGLHDAQPDDPMKGEFVPRDPTLPEEIDPAQLSVPDDENTLRPEERAAAAKAAEIAPEISQKKEEVPAPALAGAPVVAAVASVSESAVPDPVPAAAAMSASSASTLESMPAVRVEASEVAGVSREGKSNRGILIIVVIAIIVVLALLLILKRP